ncbi:MAG: protein BatD [Bdellovibrionaceae bacterium]|nr:protein BatD [Pseudobdellovibrionaceae bacterium]
MPRRDPVIKIGSALAVVLCSVSVAAQALVSVQSSVEPRQVAVGQDFVYTVTVLSLDAPNIQKPRPPDLDGFELLDTWETNSVSQKMVTTSKGMDWQKQTRTMFNYRLRPTRAGRLALGAFEVQIDGKTHTSQPLVIDVAAAGSRPAAPSAPSDEEDLLPPGMGFPGMRTFEDMERMEEEIFNQLLRRRGGGALPGPSGVPPGAGFGGVPRPEPQLRTLPKNPNEAFFIQVEVDKTEVYEGEQVTVSWYIYTRGQMETLDRVKFPDLRGFWKEIIEEVPTIQFSEEIVNGIPYRKALLASHALFPIKSGTAVIDPYKIKSRVRAASQGFGGLALGRPIEYTKSSQPVNIKVKPLPVEGRPASFTGAVGNFDVNAVVDADRVVVGQPFTLRVRFEGAGNAKGIELPAIQWPQTVEVYDTKSESRFFKNGRSYKQFEILLIPREEGPLVIPSFDFGVFDPQKGGYEVRATQAIPLQVQPGIPGAVPPAGSVTGAEAPPAAPSPARAENLRGDRLPPPVMAFQNAAPWAGWFSGLPFWVAMYLGVCGVLVVKARLELASNQRRRDLSANFRRRWKIFEKTEKSGDHRKIGAEMLNLYYLVLGGVAGEQGASEEVKKVLERIPPSLRRDFGDEITRRIDVFQTMTFAPEETLGDLKSPRRLEKEIKESKNLLTALVRRLTESQDEKS